MTSENIGYIETSEFVSLTGITNRNPAQIKLAVESAAQDIRRMLYIRKREYLGPSSTKFQLSPMNRQTPTYYANSPMQYMSLGYFADYDLDGVVDKNDFHAWEIDTNTGTGTANWTALTDLATVDQDALQITFTSAHPASGKQLLVEYWWTRFKLSEMLPDLKTLNKTIAVGKCYRMMMASQLKDGISEWALDGVSIRFDVTAVKEYIKENAEETQEQVKLLKPLYIVGTRDVGDFDLANVRTPRYI